MLLEDAGALAEFDEAGVPGAFLRNRHFERVVGDGGAARTRKRHDAEYDDDRNDA